MVFPHIITKPMYIFVNVMVVIKFVIVSCIVITISLVDPIRGEIISKIGIVVGSVGFGVFVPGCPFLNTTVF